MKGSRIARMTVAVGVLAAALSVIPRPMSAWQGPPFGVANGKPLTPANQIVTLVCNGFTANICTDLERVAADGILTPYTAPPAGFVLVVTDFVWKAASVTPGQVAFATLHHELTSPPRDVAFSTAVATPDGAAVSQSHFTSGLLFSDVPIVFVSHTPNVAILQGYLVAQ